MKVKTGSMILMLLGVIGHLVAGAIAERAAHVGAGRSVGTQGVGVGPVAAVVLV